VLKTALSDGELSDSEAAMLQCMHTSLAIDKQRAETLLKDANAAIPPALTPAENPAAESTPAPAPAEQ
jgi:hypothetical protein